MSKFELGERVMVIDHTMVGEVIDHETRIEPSGENFYYAVKLSDFVKLWIPEEKLIREGTPIERPMRANEDLEKENHELKKENDKLMEYIRKLLDKLWVK